MAVDMSYRLMGLIQGMKEGKGLKPGTHNRRLDHRYCILPEAGNHHSRRIRPILHTPAVADSRLIHQVRRRLIHYLKSLVQVQVEYPMSLALKKLKTDVHGGNHFDRGVRHAGGVRLDDTCCHAARYGAVETLHDAAPHYVGVENAHTDYLFRHVHNVIVRLSDADFHGDDLLCIDDQLAFHKGKT